jgi:hypothetical protein
MKKRTLLTLAFGAGLFLAGYSAGHNAGASAASNRVFELRTYTANDGKLQALHARFRNHTTRLFEKHGMTNIGYFQPIDSPLKDNTLTYLLAYPSRDAARKAWDAFRADPVWVKAKDESEKDGVLVKKVDSVFLEPTDYSKIK